MERKCEMESEVRVIQTPRFDTDYWLCRCEGFEVDTPEGRLGTVAWLVFRSRHDRPDALAVHTSHVLHRSVVIPVTDIEQIFPEGGRIVLAANPVPVGHFQAWRRRLVPGTTSRPSSVSLPR
jgi:hypothetical protein